MANSITSPGTLTTSSYFTISAGTRITGAIYGAATVTPTITNFGTVILAGNAQAAIDLLGGGTFNNDGLVNGGTFGDGVLISTTTASIGAVVTNAAGHYILGRTGIGFTGAANGTVVNAGTVTGDDGSAIFAANNATVSNSGTISELDPGAGHTYGSAVLIDGTGVVSNSGLIISHNTENSGAAIGVGLSSGTVINSGTIQGAAFNGATYAVDFIGTVGNDVLTLDSGQKLGGIALAHGTLNTVNLAAGTGVGSLTNPANYIDFQTLAVNQGADWSFGAAGTTDKFTSFSSVQDAGTLNILGTVDISTALILSGNGTVNVAAGDALVSSGGDAVFSSSTSGVSPFTNLGTIRAASGYAALDLRGGSIATTITNGSASDTSALLAGGAYGVRLEGSASDTVTNFGTITNTGGAGFDAAVEFGFGSGGTFNNSGVVNAASGSAVYFKTVGSPADVLNNSGSLISTAGVYSVVANQSDTGVATITNTGSISHGVDLRTGAGLGTVVNAGIIGTLGGTGTLANVAIKSDNRGLLDLDPGQSLSGGIATFGSGSTLELSGTPGQVGTLSNAGSYFGFTSLSVATGADWAIGSAGSTAAFNGITTVSDFGTLNIAGSLVSVSGSVTTGTSIDMEGSLGSASVVDFTGTNTAAPIYDYGVNDSIVISTLAAVAGGGYFDSYNTATGVLTVSETNASGGLVGTSTVTVSAAPGTTLGSNSFAAFSNGSGTTIELGSDVTTTLSNVIFNSEGSVAGGETISGVLHSAYNSTGTLISETGTLTLLETLSNGSITTETFVINPTLASSNSNDYGEGIPDSSGGLFQILLESVSSTGTGPLFTDLHLDWNSPTTQNLFLGSDGSNYSALTGPSVSTAHLQSVGAQTTSGSIVIDNGQTVTISNLSAVDSTPAVFGTNNSSISLNTFDINATVSGTNSPYTGAISGFGLNDDILLSPLVLPSVATGSEISLAYAGSLLSVAEVNSAGSTVGATTLDVGTGYAAGSFVALLGTNGVNIETAQSVDQQPLTFNASGTASFEDPTKYSGGLAPGSSIVAGETVIIASGTASIASTAPVNNTGTILVNGTSSSFLDSAALTGNGTVALSGGGTITLANATGTTTNTISFGAATAGSPNVLNLDGTGTASFGGVIAGMGANDTIDLGGSFLPTPASASNVGLSFNSATDLLTISDTVGGTIYTDTLHFSGTVPGTFAASIVNGAIVITDVPCFAAGTRILTENGQVAVENLEVGDSVLTVRDGSSQKIIWRGQRTIELGRHANPEKVMPVRIFAGAFAAGAPERDLVLSPDHALFIDGHLIEAKTLVNGATIIRDASSKFITYHHIELERHDVLLAEGLAAETYLDSGNRYNFETDAGPTILHPDFAATCRIKACAPLLLDGDILRATRQALLDRATALGFTRTSAIEPTAKAGLEKLQPQPGATPDEWLFMLPAGATSLDLLSATGVPAEISADPSDRRSLGLAIAGLALIAGGTRTEIALDAPAHSGLYAAEPNGRWTDGHARIALPDYRGRAVLEVTLVSQATRWRAPAPLSQISVS